MNDLINKGILGNLLKVFKENSDLLKDKEKEIEVIKDKINLLNEQILVFFEEANIEEIKLNGYSVKVNTNYFVKAKEGLEIEAYNWLHDQGFKVEFLISTTPEAVECLNKHKVLFVPIMNLHWKTGDSFIKKTLTGDADSNDNLFEISSVSKINVK